MNSSLRSIVVCGFALLTLTKALPARDFFVYFGTYTDGTSKGIYVSRLDSASGALTAPQLAATTTDPSYLAIAPDKENLYAANEIGGRNSGLVSAFKIDRASGRLTLLNQIESGSQSPCHVSLDAGGHTLFVANYNGGSIKSIPVLRDGSLGEGGSFIGYYGRSVNPDRQTSPHAHFMAMDPANRFALGCDLGTDKVMIYRLNPADSTLTANDPPFAAVPPGSGPRHLAFGRGGKFVYVLNEMGCSVTSFYWNQKKGELMAPETISALPASVTLQPEYTAAEILVHPGGKFVYASLRGHDSISVMAVDSQTGRLTLIQNIASGGKVPRGLGIDPTGHWLIAANQKTDNVLEFAIDAATGKLSPTRNELQIGSPVDVKFVKAE